MAKNTFVDEVTFISKNVNIEDEDTTSKFSFEFFKSCISKWEHGCRSDENLNWKQHIHDITIELNRANALLLTIGNYVNKCILRIIYLPYLILTGIMPIFYGAKTKGIVNK